MRKKRIPLAYARDPVILDLNEREIEETTLKRRIFTAQKVCLMNKNIKYTVLKKKPTKSIVNKIKIENYYFKRVHSVEYHTLRAKFKIITAKK